MAKYKIYPASPEKQKEIKELIKNAKEKINTLSSSEKEFILGVEKYFKKNKDVSAKQLLYLESIVN